MADRELGDLMRESTADLAPDVERLVAGGVTRGRLRRRRRQVATGMAGVVAVAVISVGVAVAPGSLGGSERSVPQYADSDAPSPSASATLSPSPSATPLDPRRAPDRPIAVSAPEIPAIVGDIAGTGTVGDILQDDAFQVVDQPQKKVVHFLYDATLTTVTIERADSLASCRALARDDEGTTCEVVDGLLTLTTPVTTSDGVSAQNVWVWNHGWIVSALSYNAPDGKDVDPVTDDPPLDEQQLTAITRSERWFDPAPDL